MSKEEALQDDFRIDYFRGYIDELAECVKEGVPVKSYLAWAFADNFECKSIPLSFLLET